jgi:hypothetical protein
MGMNISIRHCIKFFKNIKESESWVLGTATSQEFMSDY